MYRKSTNRQRKINYPPPPPVEKPRMLDWCPDKTTRLLRSGTWYEFSEYLQGKVGWDDEKIAQTWADVRKEEVML
jgi:hypothetical protein